jgi:transcriptional regulator with XRE-family HTH domain
MKKLRTQFKLKELTSELQCSYKTIWQWQNGRRKPNLKMLVRIVKFCNKNKINLENLSP